MRFYLPQAARLSRHRWTDDFGAAGLSHDEFPNLKAWVERIFERPAVQRGMNVPEENKIVKAMQVRPCSPACSVSSP